MLKKFARVVSILFHPLIVPVAGFLALFFSGFYFSLFSWELKWYILKAILFTTCILPLLTLAILALKPGFDIKMEKASDRVLPLLFTSVYYFLGFYLFRRITIFPSIKIFMAASALVLIALMLISLKWKISCHTASIGAMMGTAFGMSFRFGMNPVSVITAMVLAAGLVGTSRMILGQHNLKQTLSGFALGFTVLYLAIYFA